MKNEFIIVNLLSKSITNFSKKSEEIKRGHFFKKKEKNRKQEGGYKKVFLVVFTMFFLFLCIIKTYTRTFPIFF